MNNFKKEYFNDYYYFLIEGDGEDFTLSYSTYSVISENKKNNNKKFKKEDLKKIEAKIQRLLKNKKETKKQEIDELVDEDGTLNSSRIPILNKWLTPKKTMDQTVVATRVPNDPITRGYRVRYYGESIEKDENLIDEENMRDAFGFEETKDKDFNDTIKTFKKMGIENPIERIERAEQLGKIRGQKVRKTKSGKKVLKQRLTEKEIEEEKKNRMIKMVEDILTKKNKDDNDVIDKTDSLSKIIVKNLENIKKLAEKEGISLNKLINILKKGE
jgi:hypothetical protein